MNHDETRARQTDRLVRAGFAALVGASEDQYRAGIPALPGPPPAGPDVPLLVDPRPSLEAQLGKVRARAEVDVSSFRDREPVPAEPYWIWLDRGTGNVGRKPLECRRAFAPGERGLTVVEGVQLVLQEPPVLNRFGMDLLNTIAEGGPVFPETPYLFLAYGCPLLSQRREMEPSRSMAIPYCVLAGVPAGP